MKPTDSAQNAKNFYYREIQKEELNFYHINVTVTRDLFPIDVGYEKHIASKEEAKIFRNQYPYYLLHFVKAGKGTISFDEKSVDLQKNCLFILPPNTKITYSVEKGRFWEYYWINFNGTAVKKILNSIGFGEDVFYLKCDNAKPLSLFVEALAAKDETSSQYYIVMHCLMSIFGYIAQKNKSLIISTEDQSALADQIMNYTHEHLYDSDLTAQKIADTFFISASYFSVVFCQKANTSFKKYVNYERIKKATELLDSTQLSVKEIAKSVGYTDALYFGKVFKTYRLVSPTEYRASRK